MTWRMTLLWILFGSANHFLHCLQQNLTVNIGGCFKKVDYLYSADCTTDDQQMGLRKRPLLLWVIMDRVQCFGAYIAIVSCQKPKHAPDLLGYQRIIMGTSLHCHEENWLMYDRRFHLKASASNTKRVIHHRHYQMEHNLSRKSHPGLLLTGTSPLPIQFKPSKTNLFSAQQLICLDWNDNPNGCSLASCRYAHLCYRCVHNPA